MSRSIELLNSHVKYSYHANQYPACMNTLGDRIRYVRCALGETQEAFGKAVGGVSKGSVSQWENDQIKNLRMEHLFDMERHSGFRAEWIATGKGSRTAGDMVQEEQSGYADESLVRDRRRVVDLFAQLTENERRLLLNLALQIIDMGNIARNDEPE